VLCVVQARMGSKRLPGKMLMKVGGVPLIEIAWKKACEAFDKMDVVVAYPVCDDYPLDDYCYDNNLLNFVYAGDENDVLGRFYECATYYDLDPTDIIFRYTPDDYRKDVDAMRRVAKGEKGIPVEIGGEAFTFAQLKEWHETVTDPFLREHIGHLITPDPVLPPQDGLPWSIDTQEDLDRANWSLKSGTERYIAAMPSILNATTRPPAPFTQGSMEFARGLE
jgi:spore coat polysaccharide biosynthesis protein SpsF (cytidylyltransferase family)